AIASVRCIRLGALRGLVPIPYGALHDMAIREASPRNGPDIPRGRAVYHCPRTWGRSPRQRKDGCRSAEADQCTVIYGARRSDLAVQDTKRWADGRVPRQSGPTGSSSGYGGLRTEKERL